MYNLDNLDSLDSLDKYHSSDVMSSIWKLLNTMSYNYPDQPTLDTQYNCLKFIESLPYMLPCQFGYQFHQFSKIYFLKHSNSETVKNKKNLSHFFYQVELALS